MHRPQQQERWLDRCSSHKIKGEIPNVQKTNSVFWGSHNAIYYATYQNAYACNITVNLKAWKLVMLLVWKNPIHNNHTGNFAIGSDEQRTFLRVLAAPLRYLLLSIISHCLLPSSFVYTFFYLIFLLILNESFTHYFLFSDGRNKEGEAKGYANLKKEDWQNCSTGIFTAFKASKASFQLLPFYYIYI